MAIDLDGDDLLAALGVEIPWPETARKVRGIVCGEGAPAKPRHTEWSNQQSFIFDGYLAIVHQTTCETCGSMRENLEGLFTSEVKVGTGARRLQAIPTNGQWPQGGGHRCEVRQFGTKWCPDCVRGLGFDREIEAATGRELKFG